MKYVFPGYPAFLAEANQVHHFPPAVESLARTQPGLTRCTQLLSQVAGAPEESRSAIVAGAKLHRDSLELALLAAEMAVIEVTRAFELPDDEAIVSTLDDADFEPMAKPKRSRKPKGE